MPYSEGVWTPPSPSGQRTVQGVFWMADCILKVAALMSSKRRYSMDGLGRDLNWLILLVLGGSMSWISGHPDDRDSQTLTSPLSSSSSPKSFSRSGSMRVGRRPGTPLTGPGPPFL